MNMTKSERGESELITELRNQVPVDKRERWELRDIDLINSEVGKASRKWSQRYK